MSQAAMPARLEARLRILLPRRVPSTPGAPFSCFADATSARKIKGMRAARWSCGREPSRRRGKRAGSWLDQGDEAIGRTIAELFGQAEHDRSAPAAYRALAGETATYEKDYPGEGRLLTFTYMPLRLADGTVGGLIAEGHDITTQRDRERHLLMLSERDALTGLLNRAGFSRRLDGALDDFVQEYLLARATGKA